MKNLFLVLAVCLGGLKAAAVETVEFVDLNKYIGKWYEVAAIPQSFQKQCVKDTTAEYAFAEKGRISVLNTCTKSNGEKSVAKGRAKVVDKQTNAKLKVTFVKLFDWAFAFGGNYWVIGLADDYSVALVGDPSTDYAWILSRTPALSSEQFKAAEQIFSQQGYDTCKILTSVQTGGLSERKPLCELF